MKSTRVTFSLALIIIVGCSTGRSELQTDELTPESPIESTTKPDSTPPLLISAGPNEDEIVRMQQYLNDRNDPRIIVESIRVSEHENIDCIRTELQHGYNNPITHFSNPPPNSSATKSTNERPEGEHSAAQEYGTKTKLCPEGTIPRRRTTLQELTRFRSLDDFFAKIPGVFGDDSNTSINGSLPLLAQGPTTEHQYAAARQNATNFGTEAFLNLWNPSTELSSEFSLSQLWDERGAGANLETVEAGWQVFVNKYGDSSTRLFIYFTPDNYKPASQGGLGCYNLDCTGFIQTNNTFTLGGTVGPISVSGGNQYSIPYRIQMNATGDWWFQFNYVWIGYWPTSLFDSNGIANEASTVTYGGEILDHRNLNLHTSTDMGSGAFAAQDWTFAAYQRLLHYYYGSKATPTLGTVSPFLIQDDSACYSITTALSSDPSWGRKIYFGGPGYHPVNCW